MPNQASISTPQKRMQISYHLNNNSNNKSNDSWQQENFVNPIPHSKKGKRKIYKISRMRTGLRYSHKTYGIVKITIDFRSS